MYDLEYSIFSRYSICFFEILSGCPLSKHNNFPPGLRTLEISLNVSSKFSEWCIASKSKTKSKAEIKREIAQKVVQTLVTKLGQSTADQATQVALMNLISADITANQPKLLDNTQWYQSTTVYNQQSIATNNKAQYFMFGGSDAKMNSLVDSQWK